MLLGRAPPETILGRCIIAEYQIESFRAALAGSMSELPFHEKAGPCQQLLSLGKVISDVFLLPGYQAICGWRGGRQGRAQPVHLEP